MIELLLILYILYLTMSGLDSKGSVVVKDGEFTVK